MHENFNVRLLPSFANRGDPLHLARFGRFMEVGQSSIAVALTNVKHFTITRIDVDVHVVSKAFADCGWNALQHAAIIASNLGGGAFWWSRPAPDVGALR